MSVNNSFFLLIATVIATVLLLPGCTASRATMVAETSCSCSDYFPERPRPNWVSTEGSSDAAYLSHGISECTGIQSLDFKEADTSARSNLSRILSTHVESEVVLIREDFGGAGGSRGKITSIQSTDSLLEKSAIYDRWLDRSSCVLYSAVKISRADIQATLKRLELERQNRLVNQRFYVQAEGEYNHKLAEKMQQLLVDSGVKVVTKSPDASTYTLRGNVASHEFLNRDKVAKVTIQVSIIDPQNNLIWTHQVVGKGVSFGAISKDQLFTNALKQASDDMATPISEVLHNQSID